MATSAQDGAQHAHDDCAADGAGGSAFTSSGRALCVGLALGQIGVVVADSMAGINHGRLVRWRSRPAGQRLQEQ